MSTAEKSLEKKKVTASEAFTTRVFAEFSSGVGEFALTNFQRRLVGNYFIALDAVLKTAEVNRLKKSEKYRDSVPVVWNNVNMQKLARDVVAYARIGFDPSQKNHIHMVPYKNNSTGQYDIGFIEGYRGIELKATKYGLNVPDAVIVELVYSTDKFRSIKKDASHRFENYEFEIVNDFDRGEIVGGFYYHVYSDAPEKNKLVVMSLKEILKRKPEYASTEFWGGEKPVYKDNKKTDETVHVDGWYEQMCWKTIYRAAYSDVTIDSQKIDDDYLRLSQIENDADRARVDQEIRENANKEPIDISYRYTDEEGEIVSPQSNAAESSTDSPHQQELNLNDEPATKTGTDDAPW